MNKSTNSFTRKSVTKGSGSFTKKQPVKGQQAWAGDNLTSDAFGFDNPDGAAFGTNEFGGILHFQKVRNNS